MQAKLQPPPTSTFPGTVTPTAPKSISSPSRQQTLNLAQFRFHESHRERQGYDST